MKTTRALVNCSQNEKKLRLLAQVLRSHVRPLTSSLTSGILHYCTQKQNQNVYEKEIVKWVNALHRHIGPVSVSFNTPKTHKAIVVVLVFSFDGCGFY